MLLKEAGEVEVLDGFWNFEPPEKGIVPPLLVYADLVATGDDRRLDAAKLIHERYLARPDGQEAFLERKSAGKLFDLLPDGRILAWDIRDGGRVLRSEDENE